ncbi:hypothetical protein EJB05_06313, partial [Eragrostis curvula]
MEAHYPKKYVLYGLLVVCSWVLTLELIFHLSLSSSTAGALDATFLPPPAAEVEDRRQSSSSSSCEGRYVYMVDVPERFNMLKDCVEGSPLFNDIWSWCAITVNGGLGPKIINTGNGSVIPSTGWYSTDQFALEVIFHHRMRRYECLTGDPSAATAVYVPYYPGLDVHPHMCGYNTSVRDGPSQEFLRWLSSQPSWAALGGRDHFIVTGRTTWTFRREPGGPDEWCGNSFLIQPESRNMTALTLESNILHPRDFAVPYPSYFHPSSAAEVAAWQDLARRAPRPLLMAFAGAQRAKGTLAIREKVFDLCEAAVRRRRCGMLDCSHGLEGAITCRTAEKLVNLFASARFCLQPPGDSYTRRSSIDAVVAGCIPVFFHRFSTLRLQYRWHDDDRRRRIRYYVLFNLDDVVSGKVQVEEALSLYTDEQVAAMREEVIRMMPRFLYKDPTAAFEGQMDDAFDIAMDRVMERMRRIKNGERMEWKDDDEEDSSYLVIPCVYLFFCLILACSLINASRSS